MKKSTKLIIYGLIIVVIVILFRQTNLPTSWNELTATEKPLQDKTKLLDQLRRQHELLVSEAQEEILLDSIKNGSSQIILMRAEAKIQTGIDLRLLTENDIYTNGDSIAIDLPAAELLLTTIAPSSFVVLKQEGNWTNNELIKLKSKAKSIAEQKAMRSHLMGRAELRGRMILDQFLQIAGFKKISLL